MLRRYKILRIDMVRKPIAAMSYSRVDYLFAVFPLRNLIQDQE
jgi:hypothetical protein